MIVKQLADDIKATIISCPQLCDQIVMGAICSDMLSYVLANCKIAQVWITIQRHNNVIFLAKQKHLSAVVITNCSELDNDFIALARQNNVLVMITKLDTFICSARLYNLLKLDTKTN